jgi:hypothetical protein
MLLFILVVFVIYYHYSFLAVALNHVCLSHGHIVNHFDTSCLSF